MAEKLIRIGKVSSVDYTNGMIKVTYPDMDNAVTDDLPMLSFNGEYKMPDVGKEILVLHLSNGTAAGIALGPYWNTASPPPESGKELYRKDFTGGAYEKCKSGSYNLVAGSIGFSCDAGSTTIASILKLFNRMSDLEDRVEEVEKKV